MGTAPDEPEWSLNGEFLYFKWNPENELLESDYKFNLADGKISKLTDTEKKERIPQWNLSESKDKNLVLYTKNNKLEIFDKSKNQSRLLLDLGESISDPFFSSDEKSVFFTFQNNLYKLQLSESEIIRISNFVKEAKKPDDPKWSNKQEEWLYKDQMALFDVLKEKETKTELQKSEREKLKEKEPVAVPIGDDGAYSIQLSGDERFMTFTSFKRSKDGKRVEMPKYVTESGFTETETIRNKVGYPYGEMKLGIVNLEKDTFYYADMTGLPGIFDHSVFSKEQSIIRKEEPRMVYISQTEWSPKKDRLIMNIRSADNKDRWITEVNLENGKLETLDRQTDPAWISGPGIDWSTSSSTLGWLPDNKTIFFQSEETGYSHLYLFDLEKQKKTALTKGEYEIYDPFLSENGKYFFFTSNEGDLGSHQFYRIPVKGGKKEVLTSKPGNNEVFLSPDEKTMLIRYSYANKPWELYLRKLENAEENKWSEYQQITDSYTDNFKAYSWRIPDFISVPASDGEKIPARIYRPSPEVKNGAAVIFVHGAGYRQNAHKWWSSYYREYMFHNFLADNGYTVLDLDYRASAGYGRDWRTAIYRHMGGKDLSDNVDGAIYLKEKEGIDAGRIGLYGGSYGGFITLMAQFTAPGVFKAGAALRPVTDWAHYNHGYTSNILNTPFEDSLAYHKSSPIYFAEGLQDHLLICHGMVDDNVHFQDVVRLSQRLIELQKDNWELSIFPVEAHGFTEWTSWLDEYKRIYKLFEESLSEKP